MLANFRKNAGLPSRLFLAILLGIVSITFGAINVSANSDDVLQTQENKTSLSQLSVAGQTANYQQAIKQPGVLSADFNFFNIGQLKSLFESSLSGDIGSTFGGYSAANNFAASKYSHALVATLVVANLNDSGAGSLRQAIIDAGNMPGDDAIVFQVGLSGTLTLTSGELLINSNITISGTSPSITVSRSTAAGTPNFRILNIVPGVTVSINNLTISGGNLAVSGALGGGIYNAGTLSITNVSVSNNFAGCNPTNCTTIQFSLNGSGGGIYNTGLLTVTNSSINDNIAGSRILNNLNGEGGGISNTGTITLINSSVGNNQSLGSPGFTTAGDSRGGGIFNKSTATANLINSTVRDNVASASRSFGGGIFEGNVFITNSAVTTNKASGGGNSPSASAGGGIFGGSQLVITNSTISNNSSAATNQTISHPKGGGGIFSNGATTIRNSTIAGNSHSCSSICSPSDVESQGGGLLGGVISNTIVAMNSPFDVTRVASRGYNLIGNAANTTGWLNTDILNQDPKLAPLADNGGPTQTQALLPGSPAINAGNNVDAPATDQRGFARIIGGIIDIGAFESAFTCDFTISPINQSVDSSSQTVTVTVTGAADCSRTAVSNVDWIIVTSGGSGNGSGTVTLSVQANTGPARTGTVTIARQTFTINQAAALPPCTYTVTPRDFSFPASGGTINLNVVTQPGCNFRFPDPTARIEPWISGNTVLPNTGPARSTSLLFTGTGRFLGDTLGPRFEITVSQASGCAYTLSPTNATISSNAATGSFNVGSGAGCNYTALSNDSFITITSGASGSGNGTVSYSVAANTGGAARTGTITVGGQTFTITQAVTSVVSIDNVTLSEGNSGTTAFTFTVNLSAAVNQAVSVNFATANGTAVVGEDYIAANGTLTFAAGETSKTITVLVNGDTVVEPDETFTVNLSNAANASISGGVGTGIIQNDDNAPTPTVTPTPTPTPTVTPTPTPTATPTPTPTPTVTPTPTPTATPTPTPSPTPTPPVRKVLFDFDGDGKSDVTVFRPDNGVWYQLNSASGFAAAQFGISTDKIAPADFDGDGKTDLAVFRDGTWYLQRSSAGFASIPFGSTGDIPAPADFDGDGKAELVVFRPSSGVWYSLNLVNNVFSAVQFGSSEDKPVTADYDGDGKADYAVYRPSGGVWYMLGSRDGFGAVQFGISTDKPVVGDYDGDGRADQAVYRPSNGTWYIFGSTQGFSAIQFGIPTDIPAPADFDGDGKTDIAVFRPESGTWYQLRSTQGFGSIQFGTNGDIPIPNAFSR